MTQSSSEEGSRITVCVRARPLNEREKRLNSPTCLMFSEGKTVSIYKNGTCEAGEEKGDVTSRVKSFTFDHAYDSNVGQVTLYEDLGLPVLRASFEGFNTCIFAYGQTGSGKSYSMMGPSGGRDVFVDPGIIPRLSKGLFEMVEEKRTANQKERDAMCVESVSKRTLFQELKLTVVVSYMEIYQERVNCLLNGTRENLRIREHPVLGVYVEGLTEVEVNSEDDIIRIMNGGNQSRHTAATKMNERSSRSHAIFSISLIQKRTTQITEGEMSTTELRAKINLVDLAGSERAKSTGAEKETFREGANINKSLTVLGLVIAALAQPNKGKLDSARGKHVPYRDSQLTFILKESLGGNSKTFMLSTLSPAVVNYDETLGTLRYADRAKAIVTRAVINETAGDKRIRELEDEVRQLREKMRHYEELVARGEVKHHVTSLIAKDTANSFSSEVQPKMFTVDEINYADAPTPRQPQDAAVLKEELRRAEELITRFTQGESGYERLSSVLDLFCSPPTIKVNRNEPFLLNMDGVGDWVLEYFVVGVTYFGTEAGETGKDERCIVVSGPRTVGIAPRHCCFVKRDDGRILLRSLDNNRTYINDDKDPVLEDTPLTNGDVVCLGDEFLEFKFTDVVISQRGARRHNVRYADDSSVPLSCGRSAASASCTNQGPVTTVAGSGSGISSARPLIPSLRLKEVLRPSETNHARLATVHRDPMSSAAKSYSTRGRGLTPAAPQTSGRVVYTSSDKLTAVYHHTYLFLGARNSGKSSFRENLGKPAKWNFFFGNNKPSVRPTIGVDSSWVETSAEDLTLRLNLLELGGNGCFFLFEGVLPTRRVTYVLCFSLLELPSLEVLQPILEFILCHTTSRDAAVVLVGTHLDETHFSSSALVKILSNMEIEVNNYFHLLQRAQEMRPRILSCFAVNNIGRTVFSPGIAKVTKFPELLCWFGEQAIHRCRNDVDFPNAQVPERALALKKKILELHREGRWCLSSSEYKTIARSVDSRYGLSLDELHRHTQLLVSWGVLHHHCRHLTMKKHVVVDVPWVFRVLAVLACCTPSRDINVLNESSCRILPFLTSCLLLEDVRTVLPFDTFAVHEADVFSLLNTGVLTIKTATALFQNVMAEKNFGPGSLWGLLELLRGYDFIIMGSRLKFSSFVGDPMANGTQLNTDISENNPGGKEMCAAEDEDGFDSGSDAGEDEGMENNFSSDLTLKTDAPSRNPEMFVLIPACFSSQPPSAFYLNLPSFLFGPFYRFTLNIVPHNFFSRIVCRVAKYAEKLYLGPVSTRRVPVEFLLGDAKNGGETADSGAGGEAKTTATGTPHGTARVVGNHCFWDSMAWVISSDNSRALLRMVHRSLFVTFHTFDDDREFYDGLCHVVRSLIHESPGVLCEESLLCTREFLEDGEKADEVHGDKVYWRAVDENINSLEKIRQREQCALMTARGMTSRGPGGGVRNAGEEEEEDDDDDDAVIPFVRDRAERVDVEASVRRICEQSFLTDKVLQEVTATLHAMNDARRRGNDKEQCLKMDRLVDVLAHA